MPITVTDIAHGRCAKSAAALAAAGMLFTGAAQAHPAKHHHHATKRHHHVRKHGKHAASQGGNAAAEAVSDGSYSGSQDAGPDLRFAVTGSGTHVRNFSTWAVPGCTVQLVQVQIGDMAVKNGSFSGSEQTSGGTVQVSGSFDAAGHVTGSIQWTVPGTPDCDSTRSFSADR